MEGAAAAPGAGTLPMTHEPIDLAPVARELGLPDDTDCAEIVATIHAMRERLDRIQLRAAFLALDILDAGQADAE